MLPYPTVVLVQVQPAPLVIQLAAGVPEKAAEDGLSNWVPATRWDSQVEP